MSKIAHRQAGAVSFWVAVCVWFVATFPCVHLQHLYIRNHLPGPVSFRPDLFAAYVRRAIWATAGLGVLCPAVLWLVPIRFKKEPGAVLFWGGAIGAMAGTALWAIMVPAFRWVSNKPLDAGTFLYFGLLAGLVAGEINRRILSAQLGIVCTPSESKRGFHVASLMIWAVALKAVECRYSSDVEPGIAVAAMHPAMFLSVLLWSPWACRFFWKHRPKSIISSVTRSVLAGLVFPPLSAVVLYLPIALLILGGLRESYALLWGGETLLIIYAGSSATRWLYAMMAAAPGLAWGVMIGVLRWRYASHE